MSNFNQLYNYKANWNNAYSTTKEISTYWSAGGSGPQTVYDYLSTGNVVLNSTTITNSLSVLGNTTVLGNLTATGTITYVDTQVSVVTAISGSFNNLLVGSLTANEFFNPKFDGLYNFVNASSASWEESAVIAPLQSASANWNDAYNVTSTYGGRWNSTDTTVRSNSSNWYSTDTTLRSNSSNWHSTYVTVNANSASWDEENALVAPLQSASASWNTAYSNLVSNSSDYLYFTSTNITNNSANWNSTYSTVNSNSASWGGGGGGGDPAVNALVYSSSANWNNTYTNVSTYSADWNNAYTQYSTNSGTYASNTLFSNYLPTSGGNVSGDLTIGGSLTAYGTFTVLDTLVTVTSALSVLNVGTGPALVVRQTGTQPVAQFYDNESGPALYIADNGRVGIGSESPDTQLFVVGTTYVEEIKEKVTLSASRANSTVNFDVLTQSVLFLTLSSTGNWTINFRGNNSTSLNSIMSAGQSFTCVSIVSTGTTVYYSSAVQIDGATYVPYYLNGLTPQAIVSNSNSIQNYAYTIIKRGNAVFNVLASVNEYY